MKPIKEVSDVGLGVQLLVLGFMLDKPHSKFAVVSATLRPSKKLIHDIADAASRLGIEYRIEAFISSENQYRQRLMLIDSGSSIATGPIGHLTGAYNVIVVIERPQINDTVYNEFVNRIEAIT